MEISDELIEALIIELALTRAQLDLLSKHFHQITNKNYLEEDYHFLAERDVLTLPATRKVIQEICASQPDVAKQILRNSKLYI